MTGFGKANQNIGDKKVTVEIRSLNSKSLDMHTKIASEFKDLEAEIRKVVSRELVRGKVDLLVSVEHIGSSLPVVINQDLAAMYYKQLKEINNTIDNTTEDYLPVILRMPEIYTSNKEELSDNEIKMVIQTVVGACDAINAFRLKEGHELETEFTDRIKEIQSLLADIPKYEQERIDIVKERIKKSLEELNLNGGYDENRFEQEMIFYLEKLDVSEEKMRLSNHLTYFLETMKKPDSGKKLGFISQEIGREINTLGSKSNHAEMQKLVIQMKDNLEKIKEQVLNTL